MEDVQCAQEMLRHLTIEVSSVSIKNSLKLNVKMLAYIEKIHYLCNREIKIRHTTIKIDKTMEKMIWEGWTTSDFIRELEPIFNMIMRGESWRKPFKTRDEVKRWCMDNQPYYKKYIKKVVDYFWNKVQQAA